MTSKNTNSKINAEIHVMCYGFPIKFNKGLERAKKIAFWLKNNYPVFLPFYIEEIKKLNDNSITPENMLNLVCIALEQSINKTMNVTWGENKKITEDIVKNLHENWVKFIPTLLMDI